MNILKHTKLVCTILIKYFASFNKSIEFYMSVLLIVMILLINNLKKLLTILIFNISLQVNTYLWYVNQRISGKKK